MCPNWPECGHELGECPDPELDQLLEELEEPERDPEQEYIEFWPDLDEDD